MTTTSSRREEAIVILDEAGIDPRTVSAFGLTAQGYWEIQYDVNGRARRVNATRIGGGPGETVKEWREWPNQSVGSAIYQALNPQ